MTGAMTWAIAMAMRLVCNKEGKGNAVKVSGNGNEVDGR